MSIGQGAKRRQQLTSYLASCRFALLMVAVLAIAGCAGNGLPAKAAGSPDGRAYEIVGILTNQNLDKHQFSITVMLQNLTGQPMVMSSPTWSGSHTLYEAAAGVVPGKDAVKTIMSPGAVHLTASVKVAKGKVAASVLVLGLHCTAPGVAAGVTGGRLELRLNLQAKSHAYTVIIHRKSPPASAIGCAA